MVVIAIKHTTVVDSTHDGHTDNVEHRQQQGSEAHHDDTLGQGAASLTAQGHYHKGQHIANGKTACIAQIDVTPADAPAHHIAQKEGNEHANHRRTDHQQERL